MSIDWITVAAQIVNFLALVWLLRRFLYRPILDGIDAREKEIADRMAKASRIETAAKSAEADYLAEIAALRADRAEMLEEARRSAEAERDALLAEARDRLSKEEAEREARRADEALAYTAELRLAGAKALLSLTRKALSDLADETLEQRIAAHAVTQFGTVAKDLHSAAGDSRQAVALSRDPLPDDVRACLGAALADIDPGVTVRFVTDPSLAPGLTLRMGGAQVAWTVESYLDGLESLLEHHAGRTVTRGLTDAA
ncbi:MAG: F0F1 ATP synthase subunit B [Silicimonas sp.]